MADSYRPSRNDRDRPPPLSDRMTFTHGNSRDNNHRLNGHSGSNGRHGEFTFQAQHPAPHFPPAGSAPTGPRAQRNRGGEPPRGPRRAQNREHQNGRNNANGRRRGGFRKPAPHERELLRVRDGGSPEQTLGVAEGSNRFMNPDDLSDDDEAEMDVESDSGSDALSPLPDQPAKRKLNKTTAASGADGDSEPKWAAGAPVTVPKWSNPDPYTSLPPPSETTGVKRDVVQLIRKAKNQALTKAAGANAVAANDDFISFGDDDDNQDEDDEDEDEPLIIDAALRRDHVDEQTARELDAARRDVERAPRGGGRKRGHALQTRLVAEWEPRMRGTSTPWLHNSSDYAHLEKNPQRW